MANPKDVSSTTAWGEEESMLGPLVLSEEEDNMELEPMLEDVLQVQPPLRRSTRKSPSTRRREQQEDMEAPRGR